jgi:hypothetical protein
MAAGLSPKQDLSNQPAFSQLLSCFPILLMRKFNYVKSFTGLPTPQKTVICEGNESVIGEVMDRQLPRFQGQCHWTFHDTFESLPFTVNIFVIIFDQRNLLSFLFYFPENVTHVKCLRSSSLSYKRWCVAIFEMHFCIDFRFFFLHVNTVHTSLVYCMYIFLSHIDSV